VSANHPDEPDLRAVLEKAAIHERLDIRIVSAEPDRVVGTMPVAGNTQPFGLLHGGATILLAESLASIGAALRSGGERDVIGIEVSASHHGAASEGRVTGTAVPLHTGRTLSTWQVRVEADDGRLLNTTRVTCLLRERQPR
jgi:uncharacterized protein (TIGR00369 family)